MPTFQANAEKLCLSMDVFADSGAVFDATPLLGRYNGDVVCETVFSTDVSGMEVR